MRAQEAPPDAEERGVAAAAGGEEHGAPCGVGPAVRQRGQRCAG